MADKALKSQLTKLLEAVTKNEKILAEVKADNKTILEQINTIYQRTEDISKKQDEVLNAGSKKPKTTPTKAAPKKKKPAVKEESKEPAKSVTTTIFVYYKHLYATKSPILDEILEENQDKTLFEEQKDEIAKKKESERDKFKMNLLYKNLDADQKKKLRVKLNEAKEAEAANDEEEVTEEPGSD